MPERINKNLSRLLIIHPEGNMANNPSLKAFVDFLGERDVQFDVRARRRKSVRYPEISNVKWVLDKYLFDKLKLLAINVFCSRMLTKIIVFSQWIFLRKKKYNFIIGVDRQGIIEAHFFSRFFLVPYCLFSFEIMFEAETSKRYKELERYASKNCSLWIVQDKVRANKLAEQNRLRIDNSFLLPIGARGVGKHSKNRLRDRLNITREKRVAIALGSISKWTMVGDIVATLANWPNEWALIVHDRYGVTWDSLKKLGIDWNQFLGKSLFVSEQASDIVDDMGQILAGVDLGIAFYQPIDGDPNLGNNLRFLGKASGKIATYLRYGIPVITNEIGEMASDIRKYQLGVVVDKANMIPNILNEFDYRCFSNNCSSYFINNLDFDIYGQKLYEKLIELSKHNLNNLITET